MFHLCPSGSFKVCRPRTASTVLGAEYAGSPLGVAGSLVTTWSPGRIPNRAGMSWGGVHPAWWRWIRLECHADWVSQESFCWTHPPFHWRGTIRQEEASQSVSPGFGFGVECSYPGLQDSVELLYHAVFLGIVHSHTVVMSDARRSE